MFTKLDARAIALVMWATRPDPDYMSDRYEQWQRDVDALKEQLSIINPDFDAKSFDCTANGHLSIEENKP